MPELIPGPVDWQAQYTQPAPMFAIDPQLLEGPPRPKAKLFRTTATHVAPTHRVGQGFQQVSFVGEYAIVNREWLKKCGCDFPMAGAIY